MTNIFDPEYWRSIGIEPTVISIDTADEDSVNAGLAQLTQEIKNAAAEIRNDQTLNPGSQHSPNPDE